MQPVVERITNTDKEKKIVGIKAYKTPANRKWHYHIHDNYEIYCFLAGEAVFGIESNFYKLKPGDVLIAKKGKMHNSIIKGSEPYIRYVINFTEEALLDSDGRLKEFLENINDEREYFPAANFREKNWQYYFSRVCSTQDFAEKQLYLTVLISEVAESAKHFENARLGKKNNVVDIIMYINNNISLPLTLESICEKFFISKAHLNRKFTELLGQTVWQYIIDRRLTLARELLQNGEHPTDIATMSGFSDYNAFFKAYKQKYLVPPKEDRLVKEKTPD